MDIGACFARNPVRGSSCRYLCWSVMEIRTVRWPLHALTSGIGAIFVMASCGRQPCHRDIVSVPCNDTNNQDDGSNSGNSRVDGS